MTLGKALLMEVEVNSIREVSVPSNFVVNLFFKNLIRAHSNNDTLMRKSGYISNPHFKIIMKYDQWYCNIKTTKTLRSFLEIHTISEMLMFPIHIQLKEG